MIDSLVHLTPDELEAVRDEVAAIVDRYRPRNADRSSRPDGSRPVAVVVTGHPIAPSAPTATAAHRAAADRPAGPVVDVMRSDV